MVAPPPASPSVTSPPMPLISRVSVASPDEMTRLGGCLAAILGGGDCIGLSGSLGAGKSTLARGVITAALKGCGIEAGDVPSPTFTLVQPYPFPSEDDDGREIWHVDLWRLDGAAQVIELGIEEAFGRHMCLIEWPEKMAALMPPGHLLITIGLEGDETRRLVSFSGDTLWAGRLQGAGIGSSG